MAQIAECAFSIDELVDWDGPTRPIPNKCLVENAIQKWSNILQKQNPKDDNAFASRLKILGLTNVNLTDLLSNIPNYDQYNLPEWSLNLQQIIEGHQPIPLDELNLFPRSSSANTPLFPGFASPFITFYRRELYSTITSLGLLSDNALMDLDNHLVIIISHLVARCVSVDLKQRSVLGLNRGNTSKERYDNYMHAFNSNPKTLLKFFLNYPVLARLLVNVTINFIDNVKLLLVRLKHDKHLISQFFGLQCDQVFSVGAGLSDPHNGGKTVIKIELLSGLKLAYKPRSLQPDLAYDYLVKWINKHQQSLPLATVKTLACDNYGWVEWIDPSPCKYETQVKSFFSRQGSHLALFYFLNATDFHEDNFIPFNEYPIPIDLETLGSWALTKEYETTQIELPKAWQTFDSVFSSTMLPRWVGGSDGNSEAIMLSAFSERSSSLCWPKPQPIWSNQGTDELKLTFAKGPPLSSVPLPTLNGHVVEVNEYINDVITGFQVTYKAIQSNAEELLSVGSPLEGIYRLTTRALLRPTQTYSEVLFWSTAADNINYGFNYYIALELACSAPIFDSNRKDSTLYSKPEKKALWQRDIPFFFGSVSSQYLSDSSGHTFGPINEFSGSEYIKKRVMASSADDMQWQCELIKVSLRMVSKYSKKNSHSQIDERRNEINSSEDQYLIEFSKSLVSDIKDLYVSYENGIGWLTVGLYHQSSMPSIGHALPWSVSGNAGINIFLAKYLEITDDLSVRKLLTLSCKSIVDVIERYDLINSLLIGGLYAGIAPVVYSLQYCSRILGDPSMEEDAYKLYSLIPNAFWESNITPDLINGSSSHLLCVLNLYESLEDSRLLDIAHVIGKSIVAHQVQDGELSGGFFIPQCEHPLLGIGHGAIGIVASLSRLNYISPSPLLEKSIKEGLSFERRYFDHTNNIWPSYWSKSNPNNKLVGYCGGSAGAGIARLMMSKYYFDSQLEDELKLAINGTLLDLESDHGGHTLCCGEAGRLIFLAKAAKQLELPLLSQKAVEAGMKLINQYKKENYWKLGSLATRSIVPGLTDGIAGIGLSLLTLTTSSQPSCFLTLEL